jgi:deoxycytidine triphosphate deaminase
MALLTDTDLLKIIFSESDKKPSNEHVTILPYAESSLTPVGYDLRIGNEYSVSSVVGQITLSEKEEFKIEAGETALIRIYEKIIMPKNKSISGIVVSKVSITAQGLINSTTTIDPDWSGHLLLVLHNHSKTHVLLKQGQPVCTALFFQNASSSTKPSEKYDSRNDLLVNFWNKITKNAMKKRRFYNFVSLFIIILSFVIGYSIFGNAPGLIASVALGVAISQYFANK